MFVSYLCQAQSVLCHSSHAIDLSQNPQKRPRETWEREKKSRVAGIAANDPFRITCSPFISSNVPKLLSAVSLGCLTKRLTKIARSSLPLSQRFFLIRERAAETSREAARREKPLVTLVLNLTFMQTPAVKRVKLINI